MKGELLSVMSLAAAFTFASPGMLAVAAALAVFAAAAAALRRPRISRTSVALIGAGLPVLALAAGGLTWMRPEPREVSVMVDLSASTRTASYRDSQALRRRIGQLLGRVPYRLTWFASENHADIAKTPRFGDLPGDRTNYRPPPAAAVLLFSDAQFELPAATAPTYVAVDPMLEDPPDGSVSRLELRGHSVVAMAANHSGSERQLRLAADSKTTTRPIEGGTIAVSQPIAGDVHGAGARLTGEDPWPENDQLTLRIPPPVASQRWWVGPNAPAGWRRIVSLPLDSVEYLAPAVIVLENVSSADMSDRQQELLQQYVRDLGGALVILGGEKAYAAGGYQGTPLDALSPLASSPPAPTLHWILLADSSGSMDSREGQSTRWTLATRALVDLLPHLPPEDPVTIGSFAEKLRWWSQGRSARETAGTPLPPPGIIPTGPTNLEPALEAIIAQSQDNMPKELLILSDADTEITQPQKLIAGLKDRKIQLHILVIGNRGRGRTVLEEMARATGGQAIEELDPRKWSQAAQKLFDMASPDRLSRQACTVQFVNALSALPTRRVDLWNRVWLKTSPRPAELLGRANGPEQAPMVARWQVGAGQVVAAAYTASAAETAALANLVAQPPRDPRFLVSWETGPELRVSIDATNGEQYLNGEQLMLELSDGSPAIPLPPPQAIPQTAPGRYELSLPAPRQAVFATVRHNGRVLDRTAVAGRYAPEFDAIGNNRAAMRQLAQRSGGAIIPPTQTRRINFNWPRRPILLTTYLAAAGVALIAIGLLAGNWQMRRARERVVNFVAKR